jgi:hypothetical protein
LRVVIDGDDLAPLEEPAHQRSSPGSTSVEYGATTSQKTGVGFDPLMLVL